MPPKSAFAVLFASLALIFPGAGADKPLLAGDVPTVVATPEFRGPLDASWSIAHGTWTPDKGVLRAVELPENKHVAVLHHNLGLNVAVIECEFRADGPFVFYVGCDGKPGHVGRVVISPVSMIIAEDSVKPSHVLATLPQKSKAGEWHQLRVEWRGESMAARLDGNELSVTHPFLAAEKTRSWLAVGKSVEVRKLTIHGKVPQP